MIELFFRTVAVCFLMEIGSASNFTISAMASASDKWFVVLVGGVVGIVLAGLVAIKLGSFLQRLPFSENLISGTVMVSVGIFFLLKDLL